MTTGLHTLSPDDDIYEALDSLLEHCISGAPVVDEDRVLVGVLSEKDCLKILSNATVNGLPPGLVRDYMTAEVETIHRDVDLLTIADLFLSRPFRRLPVVDARVRLIGQVSRRDVLGGIQRMRKPESTYPDYRKPQLQETS